MLNFLNQIGRRENRFDWILLAATVPPVLFGLMTMNSFTAESYFFDRQVSWILFSYAVFLTGVFFDWRWLRKSLPILIFYLGVLLTLVLLLLIGEVTRGVQGWLSVGGFTFQPADLMKLALIIILAKYFSKRHIEIANIRHIIISGLYAFLPFAVILLQPDFGLALIIFLIWLGMILVSGVSKKHLGLLFLVMVLSAIAAWSFVLQPYQQNRIINFLHPLADIRGSGYNAFQSTIAVGSGQWFGKGVGYGTQSRLKFLPEYQTDFIFAAFAEEWGLVGVLILFASFGVILWRITKTALVGASNFETLFGLGLAIMILAHFIIHVGMNIGLLPITGLPLPFMSYGGSHLLVEFLGLGILMGMRNYSLSYHRDDVKNEFIGPQ